jgi:hypothetical protein
MAVATGLGRTGRFELNRTAKTLTFISRHFLNLIFFQAYRLQSSIWIEVIRVVPQYLWLHCIARMIDFRSAPIAIDQRLSDETTHCDATSIAPPVEPHTSAFRNCDRLRTAFH